MDTTPTSPMPSATPPAVLPRTILHVDLDCFFAAVEVLDFPELAGKPLAVGGSPTGRGVVSSCNYEARKFGVKSAMPMARAVRLCPQMIVRHGRYSRYSEVSETVFTTLETFTPEIERTSIDEGYLDVTRSVPLFGPGPQMARKLKDAVKADAGIVISVGVGPNKFAARLACGMGKPDGLVVAPSDPEALKAWLAPLAVIQISGVGPATEAMLHRYGLKILRDLQTVSTEQVREWLGDHGEHLQRLALGIDPRIIHTEHDAAKQISHEHTFEKDVADRQWLRTALSRLCDKVASRARRNEVVGRRIVVKLRHPDFTTFTRSRMMKRPTQQTDVIYDEAVALLEKNVAPGQALRLIGVALQALEPQRAKQRELFAGDAGPADHGAASPDAKATLDRTLDTLRDSLGKNAIMRARDLPPKHPRQGA